MQLTEDALHQLLNTFFGVDPGLNSCGRKAQIPCCAHLLISGISQLEMHVQLGAHLEASCRVPRTAHETCYAVQAASVKPGAAQHAHGRLTGCAVQHWMYRSCCPRDCVRRRCHWAAGADPRHSPLEQAGNLWRQKEPTLCLTALLAQVLW